MFTLCNTCCNSQNCTQGRIRSQAECIFACFRNARQENGRFVAAQYDDMAIEFCRIAESPQASELNLFPNGDCSTLVLKKLIRNPFANKKRKSHRLHKLVKVSPRQQIKTISMKPLPRVFGSSSYPTGNTHPWMCSLKTKGFRGRHRCGVTLLSG